MFVGTSGDYPDKLDQQNNLLVFLDLKDRHKSLCLRRISRENEYSVSKEDRLFLLLLMNDNYGTFIQRPETITTRNTEWEE